MKMSAWLTVVAVIICVLTRRVVLFALAELGIDRPLPIPNYASISMNVVPMKREVVHISA